MYYTVGDFIISASSLRESLLFSVKEREEGWQHFCSSDHSERFASFGPA